MPTKELLLRLDDGLLTKARALAEREGSSLEDSLVEYLTQWVAKDTRRRLNRVRMKPFTDRPTVSLSGELRPPKEEPEG